MRNPFATCVCWGVAAVLFLAPGAATAQDGAASWTDLQSLSPGVVLHVQGESRRDRLEGQLVSISPEAMTLERRGDQRTFQRNSVQRVQIVNKHKTRWTIIGAAVGVGAGFAVGQAMIGSTSYCDPFRQCVTLPRDLSVGQRMVMVGVITGTMAPFMWLSRNKTVYEK